MGYLFIFIQAVPGWREQTHVYNNHIYYLIDEVFWDKEPCFILLQLCIAKYPITREAVI